MKTAGALNWWKLPGPKGMKLDENRRTLKLMEIADTWWQQPGPKIDEDSRARKVWILMKTAGA